MAEPDQRLFKADLATAEFRAGVAKGMWDVVETGDADTWPMAYFWIAAAPRANGPERFYLRLNLAGYRTAAPTGRFWDPATAADLPLSKYPKGRPGSRVAQVFRTDSWAEQNKAFYHPYDRVAANSHLEWRTAMPQLVWSGKAIVDFLEEFYVLLLAGDYLGV